MFGQRSPTYSHKRVLVVAAFTDICAGTFAYDAANQENLIGAQAGTASVFLYTESMPNCW
ncbi:carbon starvation protein [Hespellia stercorisuis DSM 15480]|uniref:Carbon starvation protein n=1 Tax=Hespellia stercorisuis DSM 15480 TaxID=1121950 RepID=A0A1M6SGY3_9FIRM|nr:carbon starvation protein [Hespellia stercorisuis DSM 15480]